MIKFKLSESDFDEKYPDNFELRSVFNKQQIKFIINAINNHPDNQEYFCSECGVEVKGKLRYKNDPICNKCLKELEELEA